MMVWSVLENRPIVAIVSINSIQSVNLPCSEEPLDVREVLDGIDSQ